MTIEAIRRKGANRVRIICDGCGFNDTMPCDYLGHTAKTAPNVGQANKKLTDKGWVVSGKKHQCPSCVASARAAREAKEKQTETEVPAKSEVKSPAETPPREPGYRMIGMFCDMLDATYDRAAKRYTNPADNDRTIAEAIGDGCMWGWVARIREAEYGPDKRWAEIDAIRAELAEVLRDYNEQRLRDAEDADAKIAALAKGLIERSEKQVAIVVDTIEALRRRLNALDPAIGPKSGVTR